MIKNLILLSIDFYSSLQSFCFHLEDNGQSWELRLFLKELKKEEQIKFKFNKRKEIIKIRAGKKQRIEKQFSKKSVKLGVGFYL